MIRRRKMNIKTAERLRQLRKQHGFSQEELAEKIGVSRQAVSKWERAEASPDTDNLIELAEIYGITLDELLNGKKPDSDDAKASLEKDEVSFKNGIHVRSVDGDKVDISFKGVHVHDKDGNKVDVGWDGIHVNESSEQIMQSHNKDRTHCILHKLPFAPFIAVLYLIFGFLDICGGWAAGWIILLAIPVYYTLADAVARRDPNAFAFPVLVAAVYIWLGMSYSVWHPAWIIFFTIPFYYAVTDILKKRQR